MTKKVTTQTIDKLIDESKEDGIKKLVAGAIIFSADGEVLLLERLPDDFKGGLIELPSGNIEVDEGVIEGLKREVKEETSLDLSDVVSYVGSFEYTSSSGKKVRQLNFVVSVSPGEVKVNPAEHTRFLYVKPLSEEFQLLNISPETKEAIENSL